MGELINKVVVDVVNRTPEDMRRRVADTLLVLAEKQAENSHSQKQFEWYKMHAHKWRKDVTRRTVDTQMEIEERVWFLMNPDESQREQWMSIISSWDDSYDLVAEAFEYKDPQKQNTTEKAWPVIRARLFNDFKEQLDTDDHLIKKQFLERMDKARDLQHEIHSSRFTH